MFKAIVISAIFVLPVTFAQAQSGTDNKAPQQEPKNSGMAQPAGTDEKPKLYQPANPAPDTRTAPTSSTTGAGSDNGVRPEEQPKK